MQWNNNTLKLLQVLLYNAQDKVLLTAVAKSLESSLTKAVQVENL